jgi:hypothetical protein
MFVDEIFVEISAAATASARRCSRPPRPRGSSSGALHLEVDDTNPRAHALYVQLGFEAHARALMTKRPSDRRG